MEHTLTEYLINAVWQLPLLAGGAWFLLRMIQPRPQVQYCVWLAVLGLAVLLPAWGINRTDGLAAPTAPLLTPQGLTGATSQPANGQLPAHGFLSPALLHRIHPVRLGKHYVRWLVRLYLATMIFALLHVAQAWRASWLLASRAAHCHAHRTALADCSRRFSMKPPQVRESSEITSPMIAGIWSPVLLLPANFASFSEEEVTAALCHELAHIKRRDSLVNLACQLASMPLLWHPATHLIQRRIRMTREMACDLMAAQEMKSDMIYARCLLALANRMLGTRAVATPHGYLGLLGNHSLEERIMRLTEKTTMGLRAQMCRLAAGAAIMSASLILAATVHLAPAMAAPATNLALSTEVLLSQEPPVATPPASSSADQQRWSREKEKARLRQRSEAARRQAAVAAAAFDNEALRKQMENAQLQAAKAAELVNSPEMRQQIEDAQRQALQAKAIWDTPAFRAQIEEAQRQALANTELFNSPAFEQQMDEMQKKIDEAMKSFHLEITIPPINP